MTIERFDHFVRDWEWSWHSQYHLFFYFCIYKRARNICWCDISSSQCFKYYISEFSGHLDCLLHCNCMFGFCSSTTYFDQSNITTNEKLKSTYGRQGQNPHNKGCFANWTTFFNNSFSVRKSYVIQSSRNTFYRLKVDDPSGVKRKKQTILGDDSNARLSANV